jgi:hypothetical protein
MTYRERTGLTRLQLSKRCKCPLQTILAIERGQVKEMTRNLFPLRQTAGSGSTAPSTQKVNDGKRVMNAGGAALREKSLKPISNPQTSRTDSGSRAGGGGGLSRVRAKSEDQSGPTQVAMHRRVPIVSFWLRAPNNLRAHFIQRPHCRLPIT